MSANPVGSVGQSWHALHTPADDHAAAQTDLGSAQHASDAAPADQHAGSVSDADRPLASDGIAMNSGSGQSGSTHIVDHAQSPSQVRPSQQNTQPNFIPNAGGQNNGNNGGVHSDQQPPPQQQQQQQNAATGNPESVTLRPQGNGDQGANGAKFDAGKADGKNAGWGDGDGGGQNKGFSNNGADGRTGNGNGANWDGSHGNGEGLVDGVGNTLGSLLSRSSDYATSNSYAGSNLSFTNTYSAQGSSVENDQGRSDSAGLLASATDAAGNALHDIGQAASSLLDGRSGNRVDPSNLTGKSFNDWAGSKSDANASSRAGGNNDTAAGKNAADDPAMSGSAAQSRAGDFGGNAAHAETEEPGARFAGKDEEGAAATQAEDRAAPLAEGRIGNAEEEAAPIAPGAKETEPGNLLDTLGRGVAATATTDGKAIDAARQAAGQTEEEGPVLQTIQARPGQTPAEAARGNAAGDDAQIDAAAQRLGLAARSFDAAVNARNANLADGGIRQSANEQTQNQAMQNAAYVGEGKQAAAETNRPLVASVERVDAVAANWNIEQDEMKQSEHLDTQQIFLRQFTPALVGISALLSSAIGGTTMLVSPGGSAAPFLLGVSALLFAMGAWRGSGAMRMQLANEKSWADMLNDPAARQSLLATGANGLGLAGSVGLSLLALV